jgi:phage head maturation protease
MPDTRFKIFAPLLKTSIGIDGKKRLHGVASSTIKDRHGDTMSLTALSDMERSAANNMTIFLNHSYQVPEDVAGTVERAGIQSTFQDPDIHDLAFDIVVNETNPRAVKTWEAINGGTKLGLSIGAMIPDGGAVRDKKGAYRIDHVELLETSLVGVPANPRSWVEYAVKSLNGGVYGLTVWKDGVATDLDPEDEALVENTNNSWELKLDRDYVEVDTDLTLVSAAVAFPDEEEEAPEEDLDPEAPTEGVGVDTEVEPDITDATVSISTPYADISIDTGRSKPAAGSSQEAPESGPENEDEVEPEPVNPWAAIGLSGEPEVEEVETALQVLEPTVVASLRTSSELLKAVTRELIGTKEALESMTRERDESNQMAEMVIKRTDEILAKLASTPVGRRAVVREVNDQFASLKSVYSDDILTLLKKG